MVICFTICDLKDTVTYHYIGGLRYNMRNRLHEIITISCKMRFLHFPPVLSIQWTAKVHRVWLFRMIQTQLILNVDIKICEVCRKQASKLVKNLQNARANNTFDFI